MFPEGRAAFEEDRLTDLSPVLVRAPSGEVLLERYRWGVPQPPESPHKGPLFCAKRESLGWYWWGDKLRAQRCLAVVSGWFEWPEVGGVATKTYVFAREGGLLYFAALWHEEEARSYAIVTIPPGEFMSAIHNREPVTLSPEEGLRWLDPETPRAELIALLRPAPEGRLAARAEEGKPAKAPKPPPAQGSLFDVGPKRRKPS